MAKSSFEKLKELDLSRDEVQRIGKALQNEEFRKLLIDYVEEVQNPDNKRLYEQEITQLEKERGVDVTFINPTPGYVIKTSVEGDKKCFINICTNINIKEASTTPASQDGARGSNWSLPHSLAPPREDVDNKGVRCQVFDVVFHPKTLDITNRNKAFYKMLNKTALDAIEGNFGVKLDKKNLKFPKLKYKGVTHSTVIRKPSKNSEDVVERTGLEKEFYDKIYAQIDSSKSSSIKKTKIEDTKSTYTTPKYIIKHRSHVDLQEYTESRDCKMNSAIPKELIVEINLPLLKTSTDINLDVTEKTLQLISEKPSKYKLNLTLPYQVNQDNGNAKFDKDLKKLIVVLPVKRPNISLVDFDSGVESDHCPTTPENEPEPSIVSPMDKIQFLDENLHYSLPEFTSHIFNNVIAFTFNVRNVDSDSVKKQQIDAGIHLKFTSISTSFFPVNYACFLKFPIDTITRDVSVETWDNNVILQIALNQPLNSYYYGLEGDNLQLKYVEEPSILNDILKTAIPEEPEEPEEPESTVNNMNIIAVSYESSDVDELSCSSFSPSKSKGILKKLTSKRCFIGRSISESSLDDYICSSIETDSSKPEETEISTSLKKTVRFNDVIMRQLYRSNSSILGQKKKNQRKARNKKRAQEKRHSESETEMEDKKEEEDKKDCSKVNEDIADIFHMDLNF